MKEIYITNYSGMEMSEVTMEWREAMETGSRTETPGRRAVESTRREVARLEVDEVGGGSKASNTIGGVMERMVSKAKDGWSRVKGLLEGKKLVRQIESGKVVLKKEKEQGTEIEEVMEEWEEDKMGGGWWR